MLLSTTEMMEETKRTGHIAVIVEVPEILRPYEQNWLGSGMFYDEKYDRYCVNKWMDHHGYPWLKPDELKNDMYRKDIKWKMDETIQKALPPIVNA